MSLPVIRASEVGEFVYCERAWWLRRVCGEEPEGRERREAGEALHAAHGRAVALSGWIVWAAVLALAAGLLILFLA